MSKNPAAVRNHPESRRSYSANSNRCLSVCFYARGPVAGVRYVRYVCHRTRVRTQMERILRAAAKQESIELGMPILYRMS